MSRRTPIPPLGPNARSQASLDRIGAVASLTCAVHCAVMPFLLVLLPAAVGASLASGWVEWSLFGASAALGGVCMGRGTQVHGRRWIRTVFAVGLTTLALGRISEEREWGRYGVVALVASGTIVASAHALNGRLCHACATCRELSHTPEGSAVK